MSRRDVIYENVRVEMARKKMRMADLARDTGMNHETLSKKLYGISRITLEEAFRIQESCFPDMDIKTLFKECNEKKQR